MCKNRFKNIYTLLLVLLSFIVLNACDSNSLDTKKIQQTILQQESKADKILHDVSLIIESNNPDSVIGYAHQRKIELPFYIFNQNKLVFWNDNRIVIQQISLYDDGKWFYQQFENAHCICRWNQINQYQLLTIIPIKYNYKYETRHLQNSFVSSIAAKKNINILHNQNAPNAIFSADHDYLFSLYTTKEKSKKEQDKITPSFSYSEILTPTNAHEKDHEKYFSQIKLRLYLIIALLFGIISFSLIAYSIYKYKGFKNLKLTYRYGIVFILLFTISLISIFWISVRYVRQQYEQHQRAELHQKTQYIQKTLQEIYYWNQSLNPTNTNSLNVELRDLSFTYKTDIHVYDRNGIMVGSSQPLLFGLGFLSKRISSKPYFANDPNVIQGEKLGTFEYIAAYTDFYNGDYVQLGYIAVPLFISAEEIANEINKLLSRLVPIYLTVLILSIILSVLLGKQIASPINMMVKTLNKFSLDQQNEKISYQPKDEIGLLVNEYNRLVDQLQESAELLAKSERENAWKTMARQIAHEINNPLTPMKLTIQQLQRVRTVDKQRFEESFDNATALLIEQIDNLSRIAAIFSNFAKLPEIKLTTVDIAQKLNSVADLFANNKENVNIICHGTEQMTRAITDAEQIRQVFNNLLKNAIQATANCENGEVNIRLKTSEQSVIISVSDNGHGIPTQIKEKIFRPNFTTKNTGMGLGLAISKNIVESSGGRITFESTEGMGTTFTVQLNSPTTTHEA